MAGLARAIEIAASAFVGKTDKSGKPYILHCLWVMNKVRYIGEDYMIVAILHDLLEDTLWTKKQLLEEGFSDKVVQSIIDLTHKPHEPYDRYIKRVSRNVIATAVKIRDLEHNSKITRLKGIKDNDLKRMIKYHSSYLYLIGIKKRVFTK